MSHFEISSHCCVFCAEVSCECADDGQKLIQDLEVFLTKMSQTIYWTAPGHREELGTKKVKYLLAKVKDARERMIG